MKNPRRFKEPMLHTNAGANVTCQQRLSQHAERDLKEKKLITGEKFYVNAN